MKKYKEKRKKDRLEKVRKEFREKSERSFTSYIDDIIIKYLENKESDVSIDENTAFEINLLPR